MINHFNFDYNSYKLLSKLVQVNWTLHSIGRFSRCHLWLDYIENYSGIEKALIENAQIYITSMISIWAQWRRSSFGSEIADDFHTVILQGAHNKPLISYTILEFPM